jgi:hypothetical protein
MDRILQIGGILLLVAGASFGSGRQARNDAPPPPRPAAKAVAKGGVPKQPIPKGAGRLVNPGNVAARLFRMSPEERDRAIAQLPTEQGRNNARRQLQWFDNLPKEQQEFQLRRLERFASLPPEKRAEVRQLVRAANQLPGPRRTAVGRALAMLQQMNDRQRDATLQRPAFQARFSPEELRIITALADAWMGPMPGPPY